MPYTDILAKLKDAIRYVSDNIQEYVVNPGSDFSQDGKLTPERLITFLFGQGSKSTRNELIEAFNANSDHPYTQPFCERHRRGYETTVPRGRY